MKTFLILWLALACGFAQADPAPPGAVEKMMAQSEFYMNCGVCKVERGPFSSVTQTLIFPPPVGVRQISSADYNWIKEAGNEKAPSGLYVMTERVHQACLTWSSDACFAVRALWQQEWPTGQCINVSNGKPYKALGPSHAWKLK